MYTSFIATCMLAIIITHLGVFSEDLTVVVAHLGVFSEDLKVVVAAVLVILNIKLCKLNL